MRRRRRREEEEEEERRVKKRREERLLKKWEKGREEQRLLKRESERYKWEDEDVQRRVRYQYKGLMIFYKNSKSESLFKVNRLESYNDNLFFAYTERNETTLDLWMQQHRPLLEDDTFDREMFLHPLRELLMNIMVMKKKFRDFRLSANEIKVTRDSNGAVAFRVFRTQLYNGCEPHTWGMLDLREIINDWFDRHGAVKTNPDLLMFLRCLTCFPDNDHFELLIRHPIFYQGRDRKKLFDMAIKVDYMMEVKKNRKDPTPSLLRGFGIMNQEIHEGDDWFRLGLHGAEERGWSQNGVWWNPVTDFVMFNVDRVPHLRSLLRTTRNLGSHIHERLRHYRQFTRSECALFLDDVIPGVFSAIYYLIVNEGLATYFLEDNNFW